MARKIPSIKHWRKDCKWYIVQIYMCTEVCVKQCSSHVLQCTIGLDSFSEWLKSNPTSAKDSQYTPSSSTSSPPSSSSTSGISQTKDRLLHSEIRELQGKLAQLKKENHELRQLLKASGDDSRAALLGRQVNYVHCRSLCIQNMNVQYTLF